jgi:osmotically-inducible protein OsmY
MRKTVFSLMVMALLSWNAFAQDAGQKTVKVKKAAASMEPRSDVEVQTCLNDKFKDSKTIKNGNATVSGGVATLTGDASSGGAKGGATRSAKACGAKTITNNITVPPKPKKA